jgi:hypothetical protein
VISDYLESLAVALRFDRSLSRCVRQEVEDHLWEAVAADPIADRIEAERRAVANFGDPYLIAAQFAVVSLSRRTRRVGSAVVLAVAAIYLIMKARVAWYVMAQWTTGEDMRAVAGIIGSIDRYSFWLSILLAIGGFAYISGVRLPQVSCQAYRKHLTRFLLLCAAATGALIISVTSDGALTALRLLGTGLRAQALIPILSMAIEIVGVGVLVFQICRIARQATSMAALLKT